MASGEQPPKTPCDFDGFDTSSKLDEVKTTTTAYFGCGIDSKCLPTKLKPGDTVVVNRAEGDWTCGYLTARKGSTPGWVHSSDIRPADFDPSPPPAAWTGAWTQGENRMEIETAKTPGTLQLDGEAYWHGRGDNVHEGSFSGEAVPVGNHLHYAEGDGDACTVDLSLFANYIVANDNNRCGGMNVRFWGVWKRAGKLR
jgi:hypothetical protein